MLVLTRRVGEQIVIPGADIEITVVTQGNGVVRLGFEAPIATQIFRREVWVRAMRSEGQPLVAAVGSDGRKTESTK